MRRNKHKMERDGAEIGRITYNRGHLPSFHGKMAREGRDVTSLGGKTKK